MLLMFLVVSGIQLCFECFYLTANTLCLYLHCVCFVHNWVCIAHNASLFGQKTVFNVEFVEMYGFWQQTKTFSNQAKIIVFFFSTYVTSFLAKHATSKKVFLWHLCLKF